MESLLTKEELLLAVKGAQIGSADCLFNDVQTDSRNVSSDKPCMFVPLMGEFQNGHKYIPSVLAADKKAAVILLNESEYVKDSALYEKLAAENPSVCFVRVENTLHALQDAAEAYENSISNGSVNPEVYSDYAAVLAAIGRADEAEKLLDELRSKIPFGWKERDAYVQKLENGKFRVVYKQVHQLN